MTDQQPHTPTTEVIRETYIGEPPYTLYGYTEEEFDRWHAAEIAAAEQRGAERVLKYFQDHVNEVSEYSYIGAAIQELIVQASDYRADRLEADDERR